jgi:hypothetical protein
VYGEKALNGRGMLLPAKDVAHHLGRTGPAHLRPDRVDKAFTGGLMDQAAWETLLEQRKLDPELACWASPPAAIEAEWRCWVVDGRVIEVSQYREAGRRHCLQETRQDVLEAAQALASVYQPAPCVVMDMAHVENRYVCLEFNPLQSSGWYAADVARVLDAWLAWGTSFYG